jgi:hypothetical protein
MTERIISQVAFDDEGLTVQYIERSDIRVGGKVAIAKQVSISRSHPDYGEDMDGVYRRVERLLDNALEDFADSEPYSPDEDEEDDEKGMGDH